MSQLEKPREESTFAGRVLRGTDLLVARSHGAHTRPHPVGRPPDRTECAQGGAPTRLQRLRARRARDRAQRTANLAAFVAGIAATALTLAWRRALQPSDDATAHAR